MNNNSTKYSDSLTDSTESGGRQRRHYSLRLSTNDELTSSGSTYFSPPKRRQSISKVTEELTINKLRFSKVGFYGRDAEVQTLQRCLDRAKAEGTREVCFVHGFSGNGKTTLARSIQSSLLRDDGGVFVEGKFDLTLEDSFDPNAGIGLVCRNLCHALDKRILLSSDGTLSIATIREQFEDQLGEELKLLLDVLPELREILGNENNEKENENTNENNHSNMSNQARSQQFQYILRVFLRIVCSCISPVAILLDDLQWASKESLDILSTIIMDRENTSGLLLIGCYRSNEVDPTHPLSRVLADLAHNETDPGYRITYLEVNNLSLDDSNSVLMDLLSIDAPETTLELAQLAHQRTLGNAYFFLQFVAMLHEHELLEFHLGLLQWVWDVPKIKEETVASPNVVTLVRQRMQKSTESMRCFLKVMSCLGPLPSERVVELAWEKAANETTSVTEIMQQAKETQYIEQRGDSNYRFIHDKVLEASLSLMMEEERGKLRFAIGKQLLNGLTKEEVESELFLIADLLDANANAISETDRQVMIEVNLRAAEKAKSLSAFSSAVKFAMTGTSLLSEDAWQNNYERTLRLYSVGAEAAGTVGKVDILNEISQIVLPRKNVPIEDKLRVYNALLDSMASNGRLVEAQHLVCELLDKLGCKVPRLGPSIAYHTFLPILSLKRKAPSKEAIQKLPKMTDRRKSECLRLLYQLQTFSYLNREVPLFLWSCTRQILLTMKYGLHELSAAAFPAMGAIMVALFTDFQTGTLFARHGKLIVGLIGSRVAEARVAFSSIMAPSYYQPMQSLIKGLSESYKIGMQVGDTDSAMWCVAHSCWLQFMTGKELSYVEDECRVNVNRMKDLNRKEAVHFTCPIWQTTLNLMGSSQFTTVLAGGAFGIDDEKEIWGITADGPLRPHLEICKTLLLTYFGDYVAGADLFIKRGDRYLKDHPGHPQGNMDSFLRGVCLFAAYDKTGKRKYRSNAYKARATIASWWKKGNPNSQHQLSFLDAEHYSLQKKWEDAAVCYQKAITLASRSGLIQDAALANERYAACLLKQGNLEDARFRLIQSVKLFREWGALGIVESLEQKHANILSMCTTEFRESAEAAASQPF
ncbi:Transcriptional regulator [Seminavis robusta]|uniref:Transcriptional regulator n=1 Tax=Seminavis robusta TaxID=568900 RepID=A0A9N8DVL5_9STRA|nr:Transcriptional regulator [Seminavis robusta]|eukprot:Sro315_g115330.1 Transcriptional regulator (1098) ;mRNA; f:48467-51852